MNGVTGVVIIDVAVVLVTGVAVWVTKDPWCLLALLFMAWWGRPEQSDADDEQSDEDSAQMPTTVRPLERETNPYPPKGGTE